jgi:ubiquinone/menaquinone biosynthesis C-methylase UbiE
VDLSDQMLARAKDKFTSNKVQFKQADITRKWNFRDGLYDLVTFSLILEHIENLDYVFNEVSKSLNTGGYVYIGELHPFKQYTGTKARFDTGEGDQQVVDCFNHNVSDFIIAAKKHGLQLVALDEYFDDNDRSQIPRILTILLKKF